MEKMWQVVDQLSALQTVPECLAALQTFAIQDLHDEDSQIKLLARVQLIVV